VGKGWYDDELGYRSGFPEPRKSKGRKSRQSIEMMLKVPLSEFEKDNHN
jgi:hypothetical protein